LDYINFGWEKLSYCQFGMNHQSGASAPLLHDYLAGTWPGNSIEISDGHKLNVLFDTRRPEGYTSRGPIVQILLFNKGKARKGSRAIFTAQIAMQFSLVRNDRRFVAGYAWNTPETIQQLLA
jgi:hypothetical protein